jgi:hypothetical protein
MPTKQVSWKMTAVMFAGMAAVAIVGSMALNVTLRHELLSLHSDLWELVVPADLAATAILAAGMRFAFNRCLRCVDRGGLESQRG